MCEGRGEKQRMKPSSENFDLWLAQTLLGGKRKVPGSYRKERERREKERELTRRPLYLETILFEGKSKKGNGLSKGPWWI